MCAKLTAVSAASASVFPLTVTVRAVFQVVASKVSPPGATATTSGVAGTSGVIVTAPLGSVSRTTVYVSVVVVPSSETVSPVLSAVAGVLGSVSTVTPTVSSSVTVTVTFTAASVVGYAVASPLPCTVCATVTVAPVASSSAAAVAVTVCAVSQVAAVNVRSRCCRVASASTSTAASPLATRTVTGPPGSAPNRTV